jgi:hypothetical protein
MNLMMKMAGATLGVALLAGSAFGMRAAGASASGQFPLSPVPGAVGFGGGVVAVAPVGGGIGVTITISGARPFATYQVAACMNTGALQCTHNGSGDWLTTNGAGAFGGTLVLPAPPRLDAITVTDLNDARDEYEAFVAYAPAPVITTGPAVVSYGVPPYSGVTAVQTPTGVVFMPYGTVATAATVCPAGYVGMLGVVNGYFGYAYGVYYPYYITNGLPVGVNGTVICGVI